MLEARTVLVRTSRLAGRWERRHLVCINRLQAESLRCRLIHSRFALNADEDV